MERHDDPNRATAEIGARLDRLPISPLHWRLFLIVGLGLIVDTIDVYVISGVSSALVKQHQATLTQISHLQMATAFGMGAGALSGGLFGDWFGRRKMMLWCSLIAALGALGCAMAANVDQLVWWRLITTLGVGAESVLAYGMVVEFLPPKSRGRWMARLAVLATMAAPLTLLAGYYILPAPDGWRTMMLLVSALSAGTFLLRFGLPESARWLASRGRIEEARAVVAQFERSGKLDARDTVDVAPILATPHTTSLWSGGTLIRLGLAALINIALICATFGFVAWLPTFFAEEGRDLPSALMMSIVITAGAPVGALVGMLVTDLFERKWVTAGIAAVAAAFGVGYAFAPDALLLPAGFATVVAIYAYAAVAVTGYMPELFPTPIRLRAIGVATTIGRAVAVGLPMVIIAIFAQFGQTGVVAMVTGVLFTLALAVAFFGVRTRGRSLDAI